VVVFVVCQPIKPVDDEMVDFSLADIWQPPLQPRKVQRLSRLHLVVVPLAVPNLAAHTRALTKLRHAENLLFESRHYLV
jgi:hypothetical protein